MHTSTALPAPSTVTRATVTLVAALAVVVGLVYYFTFYGSRQVETTRNSVAFADTGEYVQLLTDRHYADCIVAHPDHVEHRRKTLHHLDFLVLGDLVVAAATRVARLDTVSAIWLITPLLGALNVALAFFCVRRHAGEALALPAAITYAVIPATWVYASIPETWIFSGTALLTILLLRGRGLPSWLLAGVIALFALNNFLLLALVALAADPKRPAAEWLRQTVVLGLTTLAVYLGLLTTLGLTLSPDYLPNHFVVETIAFKGRLAERYSVVHPIRWAYSGTNGWLAPFVLNQPDLNFGRYAVLDSARAFPLGTIAVAVLAGALVMLARDLYRRGRALAADWSGLRGDAIGTTIYLAAIFVAMGLALYYESFLYAQMIIPVLLLLLVRALPPGPTGVRLMWLVAVAWGLNGAQQIVTYRSQLGL